MILLFIIKLHIELIFFTETHTNENGEKSNVQTMEGKMTESLCFV